MAVIELNNVTLHLPIYDANERLLRQVVFKRRTGGRISWGASVAITALDQVSFSVEEGDRVGIIGHNGSGKSTLLRLLAGVFAPTAGTVTINGTVSALLSPGLGMDLEDTGFQNIINIGLMLGLTLREVEERADEVAEFTELGEYLALPARTYSAGMQLRLAFSVVTIIEPDILLLDEGLGAGDARFVERAQQRVKGLIDRANVLVIASHSDGLLKEMCNKAIMLEQGKLITHGAVDDVLKVYHEHNAEFAAEGHELKPAFA